ncbi:MMPL family transporter [Wenjunlia tyrosinilytica]|uniref:Membrane protein n=1 Tax=Wenjunlia tyrosinilytica TaxID=1544741 RepID=A0A917ZUJ3_9ACTN|nr:MMPL family transporter [Wenjunlia tyrosinilytica]GGO92902.1 membrane protein [Wenjunlia tyrosinilytica]
MQAFMHMIGVFAVRFRYAVVAVWVAAAALAMLFLPSLASVTNPDNTSFLPSDTGTAEAIKLAAPFVPPGQSSATMVASRTSGKLSSSEQSAFRQLESSVAKLPHVTSVTDQGVSENGMAQKAQIVVDVASSSPDAGDVVDDIRDTMSSTPHDSAVAEHLTGSIAISVDNQRSQEDAQRLTEILSNVVILVMLFIILRSALAPLITLIPPVLVLNLSSPIIAEAAAQGDIDVSSVTHPMLTVLLLGAGTDYGLFLVLRMREEMERGAPPRQAIVKSVERVGESITFSAGTVIGALLCLLLASFGLYSGLGPALAIGVALMLLAGLTLLPALLAIFGKALFWPRKLKPHEHEPDSGWIKVTHHILERPKTTLVVGVAVFLALSAGIFGYSSNGFGGSTNGPSGSDSAAGTAALEANYPPAVVNPTVVLFKYPASVWQDLSNLNNAENDLAGKSVFASVNGMFNPNGTPLSVQQLSTLYAELGPPGKLPATPPANSPVPADQYAAYRALSQFVSSDGQTVQFYTTLKAGSPDSTAAIDAVPDVRAAVTDVQKSSGASQAGVNGLAPASYDVSTVSNSDLTEIVPIVLVLIGILLGVVMRSLVAPLYLVASVALSYFAALGLAVIVYIGLSGEDGVDFVLPFLMFIFLMALGEDYNILVMSRIREEAHSMPLRRAVAAAMHATGTTVTSAGLILAATFGVSAITGATDEIKELGGSIAMGILLDTFLVRVLLVPATVILLGRWNWWPSALSHRPADPPKPGGTRGAPTSAPPKPGG